MKTIETAYNQKKRVGIALRRFLFRQSPGRKHLPYFGCDVEFMRRFIEWQFREGWSWENIGTEWQVEHILPLTAFNWMDEGELKLCWNWGNLRPSVVKRESNSYLLAMGILEKRLAYFKTDELAKLLERAQLMVIGDKEPEENWKGFV